MPILRFRCIGIDGEFFVEVVEFFKFSDPLIFGFPIHLFFVEVRIVVIEGVDPEHPPEGVLEEETIVFFVISDLVGTTGLVSGWHFDGMQIDVIFVAAVVGFDSDLDGVRAFQLNTSTCGWFAVD